MGESGKSAVMGGGPKAGGDRKLWSCSHFGVFNLWRRLWMRMLGVAVEGVFSQGAMEK